MAITIFYRHTEKPHSTGTMAVMAITAIKNALPRNATIYIHNIDWRYIDMKTRKWPITPTEAKKSLNALSVLSGRTAEPPPAKKKGDVYCEQQGKGKPR